MGITETPMGLAALLDAHVSAHCAGCDTDTGPMKAMVVVPWAELGPGVIDALRQMFDDTMPSGQAPTCESCGAAIDDIHVIAVEFDPDEEALPSFVWAAAEGGRWQCGTHRWLECPSEEELVRVWGRAWSVRQRWREAVGDAASERGRMVGAPLAPGMGVVVGLLKPEQMSPEGMDDALDLMGTSMAEVAHTALPTPDMPLLLRLSEYDGPEGPSTWAGPWYDTLRSPECAALMLVDGAVAAAALAEAASREGVALDADGAATINDTCKVQVSVREVVERATGMGVTLAEAASVLIPQRRWQGERLGDFLERLRQAVPEAEVEVRAPDEMVLTLPGGVQMSVNGASILSKHGWDPTSSGITHQLEQVARMLENADSGAAPETCSCGRLWALMHLRHPDDIARIQGTLAVVEEVEDDAGNTLVRVGVVECEHSLRYVLAEEIAAPDEATRWRRQLRRGPREARFSLRGRVIQGMFGDSRGAVLVGSNIASLLTYPGLRTRLLRALRQAGVHGDVVAIAPSTDVLWCAPSEDMDVWELLREHTRRVRDIDGAYQGPTLGFLKVLEDDGSPQGTLDITWER